MVAGCCTAHGCDTMSTKQMPKHSKVLPLGIAKSIPRSWLLCSEVQKLGLEITSGNCLVQHQSQGNISYPYAAPDISVSNFSHETPPLTDLHHFLCEQLAGMPQDILADSAGNKTNTEMTRQREGKERKEKGRGQVKVRKKGKPKEGAKKSTKIVILVSLYNPRATQSPILILPHLEARQASRWSTNEESRAMLALHEVTPPLGAFGS